MRNVLGKKKDIHLDVLFSLCGKRLRHAGDKLVQPGLGAGCRGLFDDSLACGGIDDRNGYLERSLCSVLVLCGPDLLDDGAKT